MRPFKEEDLEVFEKLFRTWYEDLCHLAWYYVHSETIAEDLVQDLFLNLWQKPHVWKSSTPIKPYLYRAVRNKALNYQKLQRREHRRRTIASWVSRDDVEPTRSDEALQAQDLNRVINEALAELPERRRLIFVLSRQHQLTYQEIAELLGLSVKTVETQMSRALKHLRARLADVLMVVLVGAGPVRCLFCLFS